MICDYVNVLPPVAGFHSNSLPTSTSHDPAFCFWTEPARTCPACPEQGSLNPPLCLPDLVALLASLRLA